MSRSVIFAFGLTFISVLAPFIFPWEFSVFISAIASLFFPPAAFLTGMLLDVLYGSAKSIPYFSLLGLGIGISAYFVQQFMKTRIMS